MHDTIRYYLKRRVWWCAGAAILGWLLFPLGAAVGGHLPEGVSPVTLPLVGAVLFGGAILAMQRVKCPSCKARLGRTIALPLAFSLGSGPKISFCPYCGINLDAPLPHAEAVAESQNPIHPA